MKRSTTKPRGATSYKETAFGIIPRSKLLQLEIEGTKKGLDSPYFQIPELIINLCKDLDERLADLPTKEHERYIIEVVSLLAWFQHRFVFIHPFQDYNGRTARMLTILILLKLNLPPIEIKVEKVSDRKTYLTAMQKADNGDYFPLESLLGTTLTEALR